MHCSCSDDDVKLLARSRLLAQSAARMLMSCVDTSTISGCDSVRVFSLEHCARGMHIRVGETVSVRPCPLHTVGYLSFGSIENNILFLVTSACARRTGAAARVERRQRER